MKFKLTQVAWLTGLGLTTAIILGGIQQTPSVICQTKYKGKFFDRTELFFGLSKSDGAFITESEFQRFLDGEVTPLFSDGLTLLTGAGQFKNEQGTLSKEKSKLLILLYADSPDRNGAIEQIRQRYRDRFQQESVLRVDQQSCVLF
jgi:Protein of unknown function (DUF3574)